MEPGQRHSPVLGSAEEGHSVKGILKKAASSQHPPEEAAPRLKWDEENLIITEAQKDSTMKIDEPKTPYVHYDHALDRVLDAEEVFALEGPRKKRAALAHTPPVPSYFKGLHDDEDDEEDEDDDEEDDNGDRDPDEWLDSDEDEEPKRSTAHPDHDKFAKLRAEHYKMKEAVKLGQRVEDDEDDENEDAETDKDSASSGASSAKKNDSTSSKNDDEDLLPDMEL
ncbi:hypothetical protein EC968_005365 [Mortierella alpina]|nr:hypothetical protein EC968_005365 [Mortierella alpina]